MANATRANGSDAARRDTRPPNAHPPLASGFTYTLSSGDFTAVGTPPASFGFGPVELVVNGVDEAVLDPGDVFDFTANGLTDVSTFSLEGISPEIDTASANFSSSFPTFLDFSGTPGSPTMTQILETTAVPEPTSIALFCSGLLALVAIGRLRRPVARSA